MAEVTQTSVPGTPDTPPVSGEQTGEVQPPAPNPVPATAAPSTDAVTVNTHLQSVESKINEVVAYVKQHLAEHPIAEKVLASLDTAIDLVTNEVK